MGGEIEQAQVSRYGLSSVRMVISALLGLTNPKCEGLLDYYILPTISLQDVPKVSLKSIGSWRIIKYLSFHEIVKEEKAWGSVCTQAYVLNT